MTAQDCSECKESAQEILALRELIKDAFDAISTLPQDALGYNVVPDDSYRWPIRDELIDNLGAALKDA